MTAAADRSTGPPTASPPGPVDPNAESGIGEPGPPGSGDGDTPAPHSRKGTGLRLGALWTGGLALLLASIAVTITIGPSDIRVTDVWGVVAEHLGWAQDTGLTPIREGIVWDLRLPRSVLAAVCGAGLGVCGAVLQSLLRNPLADPYVLGVSSGASTGAAHASPAP